MSKDIHIPRTITLKELARKYWNCVGFYLKYDRKTNVIEICEKNSASIEFHRILQKAKYLMKEPSFAKVQEV